MKRKSAGLFSTISTTALQNLVTIVNESLAYDAVPATKKTFTAADLWNIQRQKKSVRGRY
ncbi:MAG: hypothetical protein ABIN67_07685 [Ferruginibacter sp.]